MGVDDQVGRVGHQTPPAVSYLLQSLHQDGEQPPGGKDCLVSHVDHPDTSYCLGEALQVELALCLGQHLFLQDILLAGVDDQVGLECLVP